MKRFTKTVVAALLFALAFTALGSLGTVKASAGTLSKDLDGDGKEESIEWKDDDISSVSINGKAVFKASKTDIPGDDGYDFDVFLIDTATKDKYQEVVVYRTLEELSQYYFFRYNNNCAIVNFGNTDCCSVPCAVSPT